MKTKLIALVITGSLLSGCGAVVVGSAAAGASMLHDRRTAGTIIDDQGLEMKAAHVLRSEPELKEDARIRVVSYNNRLLVLGQVPTYERKQEIEAKLKTIASVEKIYNELEVGDKKSFMTKSSDTMLTAKVKAHAIGDPMVDPLHVKVYSENGTVYLMGIVTREEADMATDNVRNIEGVERVVRVFEYVD